MDGHVRPLRSPWLVQAPSYSLTPRSDFMPILESTQTHNEGTSVTSHDEFRHKPALEEREIPTIKCQSRWEAETKLFRPSDRRAPRASSLALVSLVSASLSLLLSPFTLLHRHCCIAFLRSSLSILQASVAGIFLYVPLVPLSLVAKIWHFVRHAYNPTRAIVGTPSSVPFCLQSSLLLYFLHDSTVKLHSLLLTSSGDYLFVIAMVLDDVKSICWLFNGWLK